MSCYPISCCSNVVLTRLRIALHVNTLVVWTSVVLSNIMLFQCCVDKTSYNVACERIRCRDKCRVIQYHVVPMLC